ncbi:MAG: methyltransferase [Pseudomonadota bacterium]
MQDNSARLNTVLAAQPENTKQRYPYRHPKDTIEFFEIEPGMTVIDVYPGEPGWYAPILVDFLGPEGRLIGADFSLEMYPLLGSFATPKFMKQKQGWVERYIEKAGALGEGDGAAVDAFFLGSAPATLNKAVDVVLLIRASHPLNRTGDARFYRQALEEFRRILKPDGHIGVVQHRAPENASEEWAQGFNGYVKQSRIISLFEEAGFVLVAESDINANAKDQPTESDKVWRLPPTLRYSRFNPFERARMLEIGESDRMTLKFRMEQ